MLFCKKIFPIKPLSSALNVPDTTPGALCCNGSGQRCLTRPCPAARPRAGAAEGPAGGRCQGAGRGIGQRVPHGVLCQDGELGPRSCQPCGVCRSWRLIFVRGRGGGRKEETPPESACGKNKYSHFWNVNGCCICREMFSTFTRFSLREVCSSTVQVHFRVLVCFLSSHSVFLLSKLLK